jgi:hypothetical protein
MIGHAIGGTIEHSSQNEIGGDANTGQRQQPDA